jgi:hypothetical protein
MRNKLTAFAAVVVLATVTAEAQNQIPNWEFDQQVTLTSLWNLWESPNFTGLTIVEGARLSGRNAMKIDIAGGTLDPLLVFRSYLKLEQGKKHYISFMAKADAPRPVELLVQARALHNWQVYWSQTIQLTTQPQTFNFEYTHTGSTVGGTGVFNSDIDFHFNLAGNGTDVYVDRVWFATEPPPPPDTTILARPDKPVPADKGTDVPIDTSLRWEPGIHAQTHNVYLGASFADVNSADLSQAVSKGQSDTTFQPASPLEYGKTYYWRVDEVNAPPSNTVFKGDVWSFTVEPYTYPITSVTATASSSDKTTTGPANTVNNSGLTNDLHGTAGDTMWLSSATGSTPAWIRYQFDKVYKLSELWVWNHNSEFEPVLGYGFKDVTIETSTDGTTWTALKDVPFAQAPATAGYAHNTTVNLDGAMARYVRLTAKSNWSAVGLKQFGLAEVRFFYVPLEARAPQPAPYAEGVAVDGSLDWRPGREATSHRVVFGADRAAVADGTATSKTVTEHGLAPGALDFGTKYYWKVDEVGADTYPGSIWSFTTQDFAAVDNFETYTDDEGSRIYESWVDGWTNNTGSTVGYLQAPFAERSIVHGGTQAMPLAYDNTKAPYYSEVQQTFDTPMDWTIGGANTLSLWFRGPAAGATPANDPAGLYVVVEDKAGKTKTVTHPDPKATTVSAWTEWRIPFSDLAGVNLAAVKKITVGVGDKANPKAGGAGMLYLDDIQFGKPFVPQKVSVEAESATSITAPMAISNDPLASGGKYIGTPTTQADSTDSPPSTGVAKIPFTVAGGEYKLLFRILIPGDNNSVWVRIADATTQTNNHPSGWVRFNDMAAGEAWHWDEVHSSDDNNTVVRWTLAPGTHTLEIAYREAGAQVDAIVIQSL